MNNVKSIINIGFMSIYGRTIDIIADIWTFEIENSKMFMMRNKNIGVFLVNAYKISISCFQRYSSM